MTVEQYNKLSEDDKLWYAPEYSKYKSKKVRSYESCDLDFEHFMGWVEERTPIGNPSRYIKVSAFEHNLRVVEKLTRPMIIDSLNKSSALMNRVLSHNKH